MDDNEADRPHCSTVSCRLDVDEIEPSGSIKSGSYFGYQEGSLICWIYSAAYLQTLSETSENVVKP